MAEPAGDLIYWADDVPVFVPAGGSVPRKVDVAIVGAGYTGLTAALHLARAGRSVAVLEAGPIGSGASGRNGGLVGPSFHKLGMAGLAARYGEAKATALAREGMLALDHFQRIVADEGIDCALQLNGRFRGAVTTADYDATARECERLHDAVGPPFEMIPRSAQLNEIGSAFYQGGVVYHRDGGIHPLWLLNGLAERAQAAGATLHPGCRVTGIAAGEVRHDGGMLEAGAVMVATNAYGVRATDSLRRRVVAIRTGAVATEILPPALMARLTPKGRVFGESARVFMWFRPTPDGRRFIFGGRIGPTHGSAAARRSALRRSALRVFPDIEPCAMTHVWGGNVAYSVDHAPHLGQIDGVWYAGGYCGSGVMRSLWFGSKIARRILGQPDADTAFDDLPCRPIPFGLLADVGARAVTQYHAFQDWRSMRDRTRPKVTVP